MSAEMEYITVEARDVRPGVAELKIQGALDWSNYAKVETALDQIFQRKVFNVIVNLTEAQYISSAGFGCFIQSMDTALSNGGKLVFAGTPGHIQEVFNILGLSKILTFAASTDEALALIAPKGS